MLQAHPSPNLPDFIDRRSLAQSGRSTGVTPSSRASATQIAHGLPRSSITPAAVAALRWSTVSVRTASFSSLVRPLPPVGFPVVLRPGLTKVA